jgi:hypothetical protein
MGSAFALQPVPAVCSSSNDSSSHIVAAAVGSGGSCRSVNSIDSCRDEHRNTVTAVG